MNPPARRGCPIRTSLPRECGTFRLSRYVWHGFRRNLFPIGPSSDGGKPCEPRIGPLYGRGSTRTSARLGTVVSTACMVAQSRSKPCDTGKVLCSNCRSTQSRCHEQRVSLRAYSAVKRAVRFGQSNSDVRRGMFRVQSAGAPLGRANWARPRDYRELPGFRGCSGRCNGTGAERRGESTTEVPMPSTRSDISRVNASERLGTVLRHVPGVQSWSCSCCRVPRFHGTALRWEGRRSVSRRGRPAA